MKTILLIDDDEFCRTPAAMYLRREEWNVIEAEDGERGVEMAIKHRPDSAGKAPGDTLPKK